MSMFTCLIGRDKGLTQECYYAAPHYAVPFVPPLPFTFPLLGFSFLSGAFT